MQHTDFVSGLQTGDPDSMKVIMQMTRIPLITYALRYTDNKDEIDDIVMRAFKELWLKREKISSESDIKALLFVAVKSGCLNYKKQVQIKEQHHQRLAYTQKYQEASPADKLEIKNLLEIVFLHFEELEPRCKEVLKLSYIEKLTDQEIAERLNMKVKTVQAKKSEGISQLKQLLNDKDSGSNIFPALLLVILFQQAVVHN